MTLAALRKSLREHRREKRLTYGALAKAIGGMSPQTVERFIHQKTTPHELTEAAVEDYLKRQGEVKR